MAEESKIEPKRRLDRSLDKPMFNMLHTEDRNRVYQLRNAMEGIHNKVEAMKDCIDDRDREISREQTLRKAAEQRLDQLVDMYGDPAVNQELKERLPRSAKTNNRDRWQKELDDMNSLKTGRAVSFEDIEAQIIAEDAKKHSSARSKSVDGRRQRRRRAYSSDDEESEYRPRRHSPVHYPTATQYAYPAPFPQYYAPPPMMPQMMYAPAPGVQQPHVIPAPIQPQSASETGAAPNAAPEQADSTKATSASAVLIASLNESSAEKDAKERELNRRITMLLAELDAAKELNEKLQGRLSEAERELSAAQIRQQTREAELEAAHTGKITALVEEIYAAQKVRDEAMLNRLRTANTERDEALLKLTHIHSNLEELDLENVSEEMSVKQMLNELRAADTSERLSAGGKALVSAINTTLRRHKQVSVEEMRAVLQDRDNAVNQAKKTEAECLRLQRQMKAREEEQEENSTTYARLLATQQERDIVLAKCHKLEEEVQTLQVYYSLHKSLSQEANLREQFNESLDNLEDQIKDRDHVLDQVQREKVQLAQQLDAVTQDKQQLMEELHAAQAAQKHSAENQLKLERLVNVLRRKIKGLGSGDE